MLGNGITEKIKVAARAYKLAEFYKSINHFYSGI